MQCADEGFRGRMGGRRRGESEDENAERRLYRLCHPFSDNSSEEEPA
jgi:hypothetical protein